MSQIKSLAKGINVILSLAGHEMDGLSPSEIAKAACISNSDCTRYRTALTELGLMEEVPGIGGRYRLGPKMIQIALAHLQQIERTKSRYDEMVQRYSRAPK